MSLRTVLVLAWKDLGLLAKDPVGLFFTIGFPVGMAILFGSVFSQQSSSSTESTLRIEVVDNDRTGASASFIESLGTEPRFEIVAVDNFSDARAAVRTGDAVAALCIPRGFDEASREPFWGDAMRVELLVDPSRAASAGLIEGVVTSRGFQLLQQRMRDPAAMLERVRTSIEGSAGEGAPPMLVPMLRSLEAFLGHLGEMEQASAGSVMNQAPFRVDPVALGSTGASAGAEKRASTGEQLRSEPNSYAVSFPQGISWGILACASAFAVSFVAERRRGTLQRLRSFPIARASILAGRSVACLASVLSVIALLVTIAVVGFGVVPTSVPLLIVATVSVAISWVGISAFLSVLGRTEAAAAGITWGVLLLAAMVGGGMIPLFLLPDWLRQIGVVSPVQWTILALEGALWRDFTTARMAEVCTVLIGFGALAFASGVIAQRRLDPA